jgi:hypothetical protein
VSKQSKPTPKQESQCFILCQNLTSMYLPIYLIRLDERTGNIFILAGEETEIIITRDGKWGFEG